MNIKKITENIYPYKYQIKLIIFLMMVGGFSGFFILKIFHQKILDLIFFRTSYGFFLFKISKEISAVHLANYLFDSILILFSAVIISSTYYFDLMIKCYKEKGVLWDFSDIKYLKGLVIAISIFVVSITVLPTVQVAINWSLSKITKELGFNMVGALLFVGFGFWFLKKFSDGKVDKNI